MQKSIESIVYGLILYQFVYQKAGLVDRGKEGLTRSEIGKLGEELDVWPTIKYPAPNWYYELPTVLRNLEDKHLIGQRAGVRGTIYFALSPHEIAASKCKTQ